MTTPITPAIPGNTTTTVVQTEPRRPFAALELPEKERFTGNHHPAFVRNIRIVLRYLKVLYLIDEDAQKKPVNANEEDDKELLYLCLHQTTIATTITIISKTETAIKGTHRSTTATLEATHRRSPLHAAFASLWVFQMRRLCIQRRIVGMKRGSQIW